MPRTDRGRSALLLALSVAITIPTGYVALLAAIGYCNEDASDPERSCSGLSPDALFIVALPLVVLGGLLQSIAIARGDRGRGLSKVGLALVIVGCSAVWAYGAGRMIYLDGSDALGVVRRLRLPRGEL